MSTCSPLGWTGIAFFVCFMRIDGDTAFRQGKQIPRRHSLNLINLGDHLVAINCSFLTRM